MPPRRRSAADSLARRQLLGAVHIAIKDLGMDDATYRDMLGRRFGVDSASKLDNPDLLRLCDHFADLGWVYKPKAKPAKPRKASGPDTRATQAQIDRIRRLWDAHARNRGWKALESWLGKYWKCDRIEWLPRAAASKVITVLERWRAEDGQERAQA